MKKETNKSERLRSFSLKLNDKTYEALYKLRGDIIFNHHKDVTLNDVINFSIRLALKNGVKKDDLNLLNP